MPQVQRQDVDAFLESRGVGELPQGVEPWATPHLAKRQAQDTEPGELQDLEGLQSGELHLPGTPLERCSMSARYCVLQQWPAGVAGCEQQHA